MSEYTPTVWKTGDVITAEKLNNIEEGIANAGGCESDFYKPVINLEATGESGVIATFNIALAETPAAEFTTGVAEGVTGLSVDTIQMVVNAGTPITVDDINILNNHKICIWESRLPSTNIYTTEGDCTVKTITNGGDTVYYVEVYGDCSISVEGVR